MLSWLRQIAVSLWRVILAAFRIAPFQKDELLDMNRIIGGMWPVTVAGLIFSLYVCGEHWARGGIWCLSCLAVGAAIGFLFGIPKVLQRDGRGMSNSEHGGVGYRQKVNTNLEEISDWLTKIIVGLGLVELVKIPHYISALASIFADSIDLTPEEYGVAGAIIVFFFVGGFLFGYLITRLFLQGALGRADRAAAHPDDASMQKLTQIETQQNPPPISQPNSPVTTPPPSLQGAGLSPENTEPAI